MKRENNFRVFQAVLLLKLARQADGSKIFGLIGIGRPLLGALNVQVGFAALQHHPHARASGHNDPVFPR